MKKEYGIYIWFRLCFCCMAAATCEYIHACNSRFRYKTCVAPARGGRGVTPEIHGKMLCGKEIYQLTKQKLESRKNFLPVNYHYRDFGSYTPLREQLVLVDRTSDLP